MEIPWRIRRRIVVVGCVLWLALARSAALALDDDGQLWLLGTARGPVYGEWKIYLEAQPRFDGTGTRQLILRPALGYQLTPQWSLWQGYGWTPSFDAFRSEHRSFQQSLIETPRGLLPVALVNRTRLEQRWIDGSDGVAWRLRHMLRAVYPLDAAGDWALAAYDEAFVALNTAGGGPLSGFDQNRGFVGVNRRLGPGLRLEMGYLNQMINVRQARPDLLRHAALLWIDYAW